MKSLHLAAILAASVSHVASVLAAQPPEGLAKVPVWTTHPTGQLHSAYWGFTVGGGGDFNGDGYDDIIVGAPGSTDPITPGAVLVYYGSSVGPHTQPDWVKTGPNNNEGYGTGVASAGDVNGDGYDDLVFTGNYGGVLRVLVYPGSATGLTDTPLRTYSFSPSSTVWPSPVASAGDVNGDGYADLIVGQPRYVTTETDQGRALVYLGSPSGPAETPAWTAIGTFANEQFGLSVASAGDVNGDGYDDIVVGGRTEGRLYLGSATGVRANASRGLEMHSIVGSRNYGEVSSAGDVNGDGFDDVLVGAPNDQNGAGSVDLYRGYSNGLLFFATLTFPESTRWAGCSVSGAGDVNADGYDDIVVGGCWNNGFASLFLGSPSGPSSIAVWSFEGPEFSDSLGRAVRGVGDVNGDGRGDVLIGAPGSSPLDLGDAYLFLGVLDESTDLRVDRGPDPSLTLTWESTCSGSGMDWGVYAGALGSFTSHTPVLCSTNGERSASIVPLSGDEYYLVVPRSVNLEGSYGATSVGLDRPQGEPACLAQVAASCP